MGHFCHKFHSKYVVFISVERRFDDALQCVGVLNLEKQLF